MKKEVKECSVETELVLEALTKYSALIREIQVINHDGETKMAVPNSLGFSMDAYTIKISIEVDLRGKDTA